MKIYDLVVPKDNMLRQINDLVDFSFVYDELIEKYCLTTGRNAISPIRMFKYLLLKSIFDLSDIDIVERSKYDIDETMKEKFPTKSTTNELIDEIDYCQKLIDIVEHEDNIIHYPKVKEKLNILKETIEDNIEHLQISQDVDAKVGHKSADTSFFGYKTHIAMTEERIITAATITTGEKNDGKELQCLIEKSIQSGIAVEDVIGDAAYSEKKNIEYSNKNNIKLVAKLNPSVTQGFRKKEDDFQFNKDAEMYVCKEGHIAIRKARQGKKGVSKNQANTDYFDVQKCKTCPSKDGCYKEGAKTKTYSLTIKSDIHLDQMSFQDSDYFQEKSKERYKIEAPNSELKHRHGYDVHRIQA